MMLIISYAPIFKTLLAWLVSDSVNGITYYILQQEFLLF
jgi:hypothetical protein